MSVIFTSQRTERWGRERETERKRTLHVAGSYQSSVRWCKEQEWLRRSNTGNEFAFRNKLVGVTSKWEIKTPNGHPTVGQN